MALIKHIAIATQDADRTRDFYVDILGLEVLQQLEARDYRGYILTDGHINLAILDFKSEEVAGPERGVGFSGLHHIGIQIDADERVPEQLAAAGFTPRDDINKALGVAAGGALNPTHEFKFQGPDNVVIDISSVGWEGTDGYEGVQGSMLPPEEQEKR